MDPGLNLDATALGEALAEAGAELAAIFDAAPEDLPSPAEFVAAFETALEGVIPGLTALANAAEIALENFSGALTSAIEAGLEIGETAFEAVIADCTTTISLRPVRRCTGRRSAPAKTWRQRTRPARTSTGFGRNSRTRSTATTSRVTVRRLSTAKT